MCESAGRLAWPHWGVDPFAVEKRPRDLGHVGRKAVVSGKNGVFCLVPAYRRLGRLRQRCVAVPMAHLVHAEPFRLHRVVAMGEPRIGLTYGACQGIDDVLLDT